MIRGTTPTHSFTLPINVDTIDEIHIIYSQNGRVKVRKTKKDCAMWDNKVELKLSQNETLNFTHAPVQMQVRIMRQDTVMASKVFTLNCGKCLENEVM
ncbi:MAG: hypothetical protein IKY66_05450 [Bacteroidales bacterium]|nr:hypothetical protein [Bacteroidales bacterium]